MKPSDLELLDNTRKLLDAGRASSITADDITRLLEIVDEYRVFRGETNRMSLAITLSLEQQVQFLNLCNVVMK